MTVFTPTNQARIEKMLQFLDLLEKSLRANKASNDDAWQLLQPVIDRLSVLVGADAQDSSSDPAAEPEEPEQAPTVAAAKAACERHHKAPDYITIRNMVQELPLKDLTSLLAIYLNRIDEELSK